ncbi:MAG: RNA polymerase sigma factor [Dehalococcoidia bacterium]|nr:RNA polymerase sigma factor [Dehalococcoidia bacterium]
MNDAEAVGLCQDGDSEAFRHLVERYQDVLYGTAYLMTGNPSVAEEYVQDAFLSAWRGIDTFGVGRPVKPWLVRILVNTVISGRRRRSIQTVPVDDPDTLPDNVSEASDAFQMAERIEDRLRLRQALASLPNEHRQVVMLRYFTGLSLSEVANVLGCPEGTVKSRLHRALERLKAEVRE